MSKSSKPSISIQAHFEDLTDPRTRKVVYPLINVVVIAICAVICGADDFVAIANFGQKKKAWFEKFLDLSAGIPSHDRFNAIFTVIKLSLGASKGATHGRFLGAESLNLKDWPLLEPVSITLYRHRTRWALWPLLTLFRGYQGDSCCR